MVAYDALKEAIIIGDEEKVPSLVQKALDNGTETPDILTNGLVSGAPVNDRFAGSIGADDYALEAGSAVDLVRKLLAG